MIIKKRGFWAMVRLIVSYDSVPSMLMGNYSKNHAACQILQLISYSSITIESAYHVTPARSRFSGRCKRGSCRFQDTFARCSWSAAILYFPENRWSSAKLVALGNSCFFCISAVHSFHRCDTYRARLKLTTWLAIFLQCAITLLTHPTLDWDWKRVDQLSYLFFCDNRKALPIIYGGCHNKSNQMALVSTRKATPASRLATFRWR